MSDIELPSYLEIEMQITQLHLGLDAAELHGLLCGYLSGADHALSQSDWLSQVVIDAEPVQADSPLATLFTTTAQRLESPDFDFELLLPDSELSITERGDALLSWSRGFLGGFGLSAGVSPPLSEESKDALNDLVRIAASDFSYEDDEEDLEALEEVTEFVRVAVLLIHNDCVLGLRHKHTLN